MVQPFGLSLSSKTIQKPPDIELKSDLDKSIVYFFQLVVNLTFLIHATSESPKSPEIPPILTSDITS